MNPKRRPTSFFFSAGASASELPQYSWYSSGFTFEVFSLNWPEVSSRTNSKSASLCLRQISSGGLQLKDLKLSSTLWSISSWSRQARKRRSWLVSFGSRFSCTSSEGVFSYRKHFNVDLTSFPFSFPLLVQVHLGIGSPFGVSFRVCFA